MIKDVAYWRAWELQEAAREPVHYERNLRLFDMMVEHARLLHRWPPADALEGLEEKILWLRRLHGSNDSGPTGR